MSDSEVGGQIKTRVDELIRLIETREQISAPDAARELGVEQETVESWARFLEKTGDIKIVYKGLTPTFQRAKEVVHTKEPEQHHENPWHALSDAVSSHLSNISDAIGAKAYEKVKPAVQALKEQVATVRSRLESTSLEAKDRQALEQSIERVESRIETVENNASANRSVKLKRETKQLTKEITKLTSHLSTLNASTTDESPVETDLEEEFEEDTSFEDRITELESQARAAVEAGDLEKAESVYAQIRELYEETLPKQYEQMRTTLKDHIYSLKKDITFASGEYEKRMLTERIQRINERLEAYEQAITTDSWSELEAIEQDIVDSYNRLPTGLEDEKKRIEGTLGALIITAAKRRRTQLNDQLKELSAQIEEMRGQMNAALASNDFGSAYQAYNAIRERFERIPQELVVERIESQASVLDDYKRLSAVFKERFIAKNEKHIEACTHLIEAVKRGIREARISDAQESYEQALAELNLIDHNYFEQRSRLQYDLMRAHSDLLEHGSQTTQNTFETIVAQFQKKLHDGHTHVSHGEIELAEHIYLELLEMYRTLPSGHDERKQALREQIFDYYKEITAPSTDEAPVSLDEILERLVAIHHALNSGDPTVLTTEVRRVEQLIDPLPDQVRKQNPMLDRELLRLVHLRRIYEGILNANARLDQGDGTGIARFIAESEGWIDSENVSAKAVTIMIRALASRLSTQNTRGVQAPQERPLQPDESDDMEVADLNTRINSIRSLLKD